MAKGRIDVIRGVVLLELQDEAGVEAAVSGCLAWSVEIVFTDKRLWNTAWQLYEMHKDKEWSLTDCISMVVMKERQISEVLTKDHHFEQAGFVKLLHH